MSSFTETSRLQEDDKKKKKNGIKMIQYGNVSRTLPVLESDLNKSRDFFRCFFKHAQFGTAKFQHPANTQITQIPTFQRYWTSRLQTNAFA